MEYGVFRPVTFFWELIVKYFSNVKRNLQVSFSWVVKFLFNTLSAQK